MGKLMVFVLVGVACGSGSDQKLDPTRLPPELMGLAPGEATEAQVVAALPGKEVARD